MFYIINELLQVGKMILHRSPPVFHLLGYFLYKTDNYQLLPASAAMLSSKSAHPVFHCYECILKEKLCAKKLSHLQRFIIKFRIKVSSLISFFIDLTSAHCPLLKALRIASINPPLTQFMYSTIHTSMTGDIVFFIFSQLFLKI